MDYSLNCYKIIIDKYYSFLLIVILPDSSNLMFSLTLSFIIVHYSYVIQYTTLFQDSCCTWFLHLEYICCAPVVIVASFQCTLCICRSTISIQFEPMQIGEPKNNAKKTESNWSGLMVKMQEQSLYMHCSSIFSIGLDQLNSVILALFFGAPIRMGSNYCHTVDLYIQWVHWKEAALSTGAQQMYWWCSNHVLQVSWNEVEYWIWIWHHRLIPPKGAAGSKAVGIVSKRTLDDWGDVISPEGYITLAWSHVGHVVLEGEHGKKVSSRGLWLL